MNQNIQLEELKPDTNTEGAFYILLGVLFYCHNGGVSVQKGLHTVRRLGKPVASIEETRFILTYLCIF